MITLLDINNDGPVLVRDWTGFVYEKGAVFGVFGPEDFDRIIGFINKHGGPPQWSVEPFQMLDHETLAEAADRARQD